ncbi:hypothetical protein NIES4071_16990 [Calothrix sp. NIES-4071]|nr:hypothetical protein NIES4071_16990 [Calothrix sp. NIES-4071]BAZ56032.1 hypothetical protein NIES4105_16940 [Calothrix sp. NIES-4105]
MTNFTLQQQNFTSNDISTRLQQLGANLASIQTLFTDASQQQAILNLAKESRYFIEWTVPDMVKKDDIDQAAELVDLGRVLTCWLFDKEKIWSDSTDNLETRTQASSQAQQWSQRVSEISQTYERSVSNG